MDGGEETPFFRFSDLNETFIFMSKFSMVACPPMGYELVVQKKGRTHIVISCPEKTKSFEENLVLIFQSLSFKMDLNKKLKFVGLF